MLKQKVYDWKDTNLALIGSDADIQARMDSAEHEIAWKGVGEKPEIKVWRIEKFKVVDWPKNKYGSFHTGDSYIVLHTYKQSDANDKLLYDVYFWIGDESTQDEYGTAAYKTVELDNKLHDAAVEHREVQYHESQAFKNLFDGKLEYLEGGVESGFNHYEPESHAPELFRVKGKKDNMEFVRVKLRRDNMNSDDVFILDTWMKIFQWNGKNANPNEKLKATAYLDSVVGARGGECKKVVLDEGSAAIPPPGENADQKEEKSDWDEFWSLIPGEWKLGGCIPLATYEVKEHADASDESVQAFRKQLYKLHQNDSGSLSFSRVTKANMAKGNKLPKDKLNSQDVFILDDGFMVWVWVGKNATAKERGQGFTYAMKYIKDHGRPSYMPITQVRDGAEPLTFSEHLHNDASSSCVIA